MDGNAMMLFLLLDLLWQVKALNCSSGRRSSEDFFICGANGCCVEGCVENDLGQCVEEDCTTSLTGWLHRSVTVSCYFHWAMILCAALTTALMTLLVLYALGLQLRKFFRQRFNARYRPIKDVSGVSIGSTLC
ncbi:uncharacterized protein [Drosophila pseudoobscura]|uniref:Uncharacterized protein n=1 Tax=Drosophila pseudoobscura pseudoobscura TaxID=46245 RepID=A0A6I8UM37_DROPS|nr:uncharacterized protein LOC4800325 [Drosophila pseudoobscura]